MQSLTGYTLNQEKNKTTVTCTGNGEQSTYHCNGTAWIGQMPNCTAAEPERELGEVEKNDHTEGRQHMKTLVVSIGFN